MKNVDRIRFVPKKMSEKNLPDSDSDQKIHPVTVVIINYNGRSYLEESLLSIEKAEGDIADVFLIDDFSTDGSVAFVRKRFPWVKIVRHTQNCGPGAARNTGIHKAMTDMVCLLDNDVVVDPRWLVKLTEAMAAHENAAMASSRIMVYEKPGTIGSDELNLHFLGMPTLSNQGKNISESRCNGVFETSVAGGASILIRKSKIGKLSFDPDFFYGFEDTEFCAALRCKGEQILLSTESMVFHKYEKGGVSGLSDSRDEFAARRAFYMFRNRWFIILQFFSKKTLLALLPALILFEALTILFAVKRSLFGAYLKAVSSLARNLHKIIKKRKKIADLKRIPDSKLLSAFPLSPGKATVQNEMESRTIKIINRLLSIYWNAVRSYLN